MVLMSGVISVCLGIFLRIGRRISDTIKAWSDIPDWLFVCVGTACVFWAGYAAWKDKTQQLLVLQERLKSPELKLEIGNTWWGSRDGHLQFILSGLLSNPHGPDSGVTNWKLTLDVPDSTPMEGVLIPGRNDNLVFGDIIFIPSEYWPRRAADPIRSGGSCPGWIWFVFPRLTNEEFRKLGKTTITLSVDDIVSGKTHYATQIIDDTTKGINIPWNPSG
jgi:hypothetical protein